MAEWEVQDIMNVYAYIFVPEDLCRSWCMSRIQDITFSNYMRMIRIQDIKCFSINCEGLVIFCLTSTSFLGYPFPFNLFSCKVKNRYIYMSLIKSLISCNKPNKQLTFNLDFNVICAFWNSNAFFQKATKCFSIVFSLPWRHVMLFKSNK